MAYKVDTNVPLPTPRGHKYPFAEMKVGHSFFIKAKDNAEARKLANNACVLGRVWAQRVKSSAKFSYRAVGGGARIWRIK